MEREFTMTKRDGVRVHRDKKQWGESSPLEKERWVRVHLEKERWRGNSP